MPQVKASGADFHYEIIGRGEPLVLLAGYTCDHQFWLPVADALGAHFQTILIDNRASGQTRDAGAAMSAASMAEDVVAVMQALGIDKAHLVGHSMGGTVAQAIARAHAERIERLALLCTTSKWSARMLFAFRALLDLRRSGANADIVLNATLPWIQSDAFLQNEKAVRALRESVAAQTHPQTVEDQARQFTVLASFDGRGALRSFDAPTLLCSGRHDLVARPGEVASLAAEIPGARCVELDCAHGITNEIPEALAETLIGFLRPGARTAPPP